VDVRDIADLHYRAIMAPEARGQRYIGAGSFYWMADIAKVMIRLSALFDPVVRDRLCELGKFRPVSSDKARTGFGWRPRPNEDTIVTAAESLIAEGIVKA
jgi:dihydroflavonol-4-reductase